MINHWTAGLFVWTLALARGFSHTLVAQRRFMSFAHQQRTAPTRSLGLILRGGQQQDDEASLDSTLSSEASPLSDSPSSTSSKNIKSAAPIAAMTSTLASFPKFYEGSLARRPIFTKSMTAGIIFGLSDYLAQKIESSRNPQTTTRPPLDWTRLLASTAVGLLYFGPAAHYWYEWVFRILPGTSLVSTLQKAALGQLLFGPSFTCIFFGVGLAQSGKFTMKNWFTKIRQDLFGAWLAGTSFWPLVDVISFSVVPQKYIPLFINLCSMVWQIYLSLLSNRSNNSKATPGAA